MTLSDRGGYVLCEDVFKIYKIADLEVVALRGLDLDVTQGEIVAIVGASGSGKSTLLNILAGYDSPSAGKVSVGGRDLLTMTARQVEEYRRDDVGFIWQQTSRNMFPYLTSVENVALPMMRNLIAITVLFSIIVTFANFAIVRVLTQGGPRNSTHLFATYAFRLGIETGDVPLGAAVSLFMFPVLAVFAFIILRNVRRRAREI